MSKPFEVRWDGEVTWGGHWLPRLYAERLLNSLRQDPNLQHRADELQCAMREAYQEEDA